MKLCAVLIPSRSRFDRLLNTIRSVIACAGSDDFEIIVRLDFDDPQLPACIASLGAFPQVRAVIGHRLGGYADIDPVFNTEMSRLTSAKWIWLMNDDAVMEGEKWVEKLRVAPLVGTVVQPEIIKLGFSTYARQDWTNFPCVPNQCWRDFGWPHIAPAADLEFYRLLNQNNDWTTTFLKGIAISHQRDNDEALSIHRKL